ncbi:MAG: hypothetical protein GY803_22330 [Chloroflexi bacterium]|nr:hypothetical protein [Chloroflexota bacterium]
MLLFTGGLVAGIVGSFLIMLLTKRIQLPMMKRTKPGGDRDTLQRTIEALDKVLQTTGYPALGPKQKEGLTLFLGQFRG